MRYLHKIDALLARIEKYLILLLFSALILLVALNILLRNLFHVSFQKILELAPVIVLWLSLAGSTLALKQQRHIKLELFLRYLPVTYRSAARLASCAFGITVMGILFGVSLEFVKNEIDIFGPWGCFSVIFPLFFAVCLFRYFVSLADFRQRIPEMKTDGVSPFESPGNDDKNHKNNQAMQ